VCSALTYSVLQCPGVMTGFTGDDVWAHLAACASRDDIRPGPIMEHGTWTLKSGSEVTQCHWKWYHSVDCVLVFYKNFKLCPQERYSTSKISWPWKPG